MTEPTQSPSRSDVLDETRRFVTWASIGVVNTLIHLTVVVLLVEAGGTGSVLANGLAFTAANIFSFFANSLLTFRSHPTVRRYAKFLSVSLSGLLVSLGSSYFATLFDWHYLIGVAIGFVVLPLITYLSHRLWTWRS